MTILTANSEECRRAWEAMPWVFQDRPPAEQSEWLTAHLAICQSCRQAFDQQRCLRHTLLLPTGVRLDADVGLRHLLERIDASEAEAMPARHRASAAWLQPALLAAVLIQGFGVSVLGARLWHPGPPAAYRTLGQEPSPAPAGTIRVVPDAAMALTDWNALLHVLHLRVVGGPDAAGAYTVAPMSSTATTRHTLAQLRATRGVRLAEAVTGAR